LKTSPIKYPSYQLKHNYLANCLGVCDISLCKLPLASFKSVVRLQGDTNKHQQSYNYSKDFHRI
jgi:hypothetical protein